MKHTVFLGGIYGVHGAELGHLLYDYLGLHGVILEAVQPGLPPRCLPLLLSQVFQGLIGGHLWGDLTAVILLQPLKLKRKSIMCAIFFTKPVLV